MDQISTVKGLGLISHRTHSLEEAMGQLERPLQLTTLSAGSVLRGSAWLCSDSFHPVPAGSEILLVWQLP